MRLFLANRATATVRLSITMHWLFKILEIWKRQRSSMLNPFESRSLSYLNTVRISASGITTWEPCSTRWRRSEERRVGKGCRSQRAAEEEGERERRRVTYNC